MKGSQKMTLTYASVQEAIEEYINRHFESSHEMVLEGWLPTPNQYGAEPTVDIAFHPGEASADDSSQKTVSE